MHYATWHHDQYVSPVLLNPGVSNPKPAKTSKTSKTSTASISIQSDMKKLDNIYWKTKQIAETTDAPGLFSNSNIYTSKKKNQSGGKPAKKSKQIEDSSLSDVSYDDSSSSTFEF